MRIPASAIIFSVFCIQICFVLAERSFVVDYANKRFLKDGEPFQFMAGLFDYYRAVPESWERKLRTMRSAGLNTVMTNIDWSHHNPAENNFTWDGIMDLERFIRLAAKQNLYVMVNPGPGIMAEIDNVRVRFLFLVLVLYKNIIEIRINLVAS